MVYAGITVYAYFLDSVGEFYALAVTVGLVQGGVQSLSRSLFGRLVPEGKNAEFFGFYNMMGKFATVLGPLLIAIVAERHAQRARLDHLAGVVVRGRRRAAVARADHTARFLTSRSKVGDVLVGWRRGPKRSRA